MRCRNARQMLVVAAMLAASTTSCARQRTASKEVPGLPVDPAARAFAEDAIAVEKQGAFEQIAWRPSAASALADAARDDKPILAFYVVGELGRKEADAC